MWTHPGKKLLFMGGEFAQEREWNHDAGLDWFLLDEPEHRGVQTWSATSTRSTATIPRCTRATATRPASAGW